MNVACHMYRQNSLGRMIAMQSNYEFEIMASNFRVRV